ncbi:MAG: hypothetical protein QW416_03420 [Candidatus Nitrosocaldaceae archaeon]
MKISISGIRGIFGSDLTLDTILLFAKRFSSLLKSKGINRCVVGMDTRESSKIISNVAISALLTYGINVYNLGIAPTPFIFRESRRYGAGLIITSSHNPLEWNGLKFVIEGRGLFEHELSTLLNIEEPKSSSISKEEIIEPSYLNDISSLNISANASIAIDTAGGAAKEYAKILLENIGCKVYSINYEKAGYPDPTTNTLSNLSKTVRENNCSLGFAYDLDGDRLVVMDRYGNVLQPDTTLLLAIAKFASLGIKRFVVSVDTSNSIRDLVKSKGLSLIYSKVGEANVLRVMLENDIKVGGEGSSGGVIYAPFNMCRDGLLASMIISSMINSKEYEECLNTKYTTIRTKFNIQSEIHDKVIGAIETKLEHDSYEISRLDGIKGFIDDNTWILVRRSNTEDIIRLSIESDNKTNANKLLKDYENLIESTH